MCKGGSQDDVAKAKAEQEDRNRNKNIEKDLKAARELLERTVKMILLGMRAPSFARCASLIRRGRHWRIGQVNNFEANAEVV